MHMASFTDIVFNAASQDPMADIYSLSAADNSFILTSLTGTYSGQTVVGILYDGIAGAGTATASLSVAGGTTFKVAPAYNNTQAALYFADRSSVLFIILTGTATQTVTGTFETSNGPIERRLRALEYI